MGSTYYEVCVIARPNPVAQTLREAYGSPRNLLARLSRPYREEVSQRFAAYLGRIGVPVPHKQLRAESIPAEAPLVE